MVAQVTPAVKVLFASKPSLTNSGDTSLVSDRTLDGYAIGT